jgi:hypothetical protein
MLPTIEDAKKIPNILYDMSQGHVILTTGKQRGIEAMLSLIDAYTKKELVDSGNYDGAMSELNMVVEKFREHLSGKINKNQALNWLDMNFKIKS